MKIILGKYNLKKNNSFKHYLLFTILSCFLQPLSANNSNQSAYFNPESYPLDSVINWLDDNIYVDSNNFHEIAHYALNKAYSNNDDKAIAQIHRNLSYWYSYFGLYPVDSSIFHAEKSLAIFIKLKDKENTAINQLDLAIDYMNNNQTSKAEKAILKAVSIYEEENNEEGLAEAYRNLATFYRVIESYEKSIEYADKGIESFEKFDNYYGISVSLFNHIISYNALKEYDKAIEAANRGIELASSKLQHAPGVLFRMYSFRGDVYIKKGNYSKALQDFTKAWQLASDAFGENAAISFRTDIGKALHYLGKNEEAIEHLLAGIRAMEAQGSENISEVPYLDLYKCYKAVGDYQNALFYYDKAATIKSNTADNKIANLESEALLKYETEKKDEAIALQQVQLKQKNKIQRFIIGIVGLLSLLLFALFYFFRKNQKIKLALEKKNAENELLLKEIHHRVKNNLQTISSLLSLQSNSIDDENALNAVNESKNRVASMALIHQKLYQGENLAAIEMRDYFETIGKAIINSFGEKAKNVDLKVDMSTLELDVDTAVPIGLITNELITNSLKHAFQEQNDGLISITLRALENNTYQLQITDNGVNEFLEKAHDSSNGFGSLLIQLLTTQLGGKLEKSTEHGTSTTIQFSLQEKAAA